MIAPLLDTHTWVWWLLGDSRLSEAERECLDRLPRGQRPILCDISIWEVALLVQVGRLRLELPLESWLATATAMATVRVVPITSATVVEMTKLPRSFHQDPADRLIVAAARTLELPLCTYDQQILGSGLVTPWKV
jgi:PIN domain nuclease of toxin-antitoxin system